MVARPGTYQASNNAGELKPELHGRTDIKQFYAGLAYALNVEPVPQGGSRLSPRSRFISRIRNALTPVPTLNVVIDPGPHSTIGALPLQLSFSYSPPINSLVLSGIFASHQLGRILQIEWFDETTWHPFGDPFSVGTSASTRTIALPPGTSVVARALRMRFIAAPASPTTFTIDAVTPARASAALSKVRLRPFTFALDQSYVAVLTDGIADFFRETQYVAGASTGVSQSQLSLLDTQQRFDTMLLFHEDLQPVRILRNGDDSEWVADKAPLSNIPQVDLGGAYTNQVTDEWQIYVRYPTADSNYANGLGLFVSVNVNGSETPGIASGAPDWPGFIASMKNLIEQLPGVGPGITITEDHSASGVTVVRLQFTGADNNGAKFSVSAQVVNTGEAAAVVTHSVTGKPGGEPLMSGVIGWPACAMFYQERLIEAGFKAKRGAMLASVTADYFNLDTEIVAPSGAVLVNLDTDGAERIQHLARARHLVVFTSDAEYFVSDRALDRTVTPNVVNTSRNGSAAGVPIVENDGSLIYLSRNGGLIYAMAYNDVSQAYLSDPISLLASHIASDIVDIAIQKASTATDAARLWMVRSDGTMTLGVMLRNQDVVAFVRWQTDGLVRAVCVDGLNRVHIAVERVVAGVSELHLERMELGLIFDGAIEQTFADPVAIVPNLECHEGAEVWAQADGFVVGPFTVHHGAIELDEPAAHIMVGRWTPFLARTLPLPSEVAERIVVKKPKRVHTVRLDLVDTTSVAVGANGHAAKNVDLFRAGDPTDVPLAPVNRTIVVSGLTGFTNEGQVEITQTKPGLAAWRGITIEATR